MNFKDFNKESFYKAIYEVLALPYNEDDNVKFKSLPVWDSLNTLLVLSMIDENYNVTVSPQEINSVETINEFYTLIKNKIS